MFSGLVEEIGRIDNLTRLPSGQGLQVELRARMCDAEMKIGDSVAVSGVCLTVTEVAPATSHMKMIIGPETLARSTFGALNVGDAVNLERALRLSDRLGGHMVAGHVDAVGDVVRTTQRAEAWDVAVKVPASVARYIIEKGSIAVDGISLTVNEIADATFSVSLIPHTQHATTLFAKRAGDRVNIEVDMVGKYIERFTHAWAAHEGTK